MYSGDVSNDWTIILTIYDNKYNIYNNKYILIIINILTISRYLIDGQRWIIKKNRREDNAWYQLIDMLDHGLWFGAGGAFLFLW